MALCPLQEWHNGIREPAYYQRKQLGTIYHYLSWYLFTPGTTDYTRWFKCALLLLLLAQVTYNQVQPLQINYLATEFLPKLEL